MSDVVRVSNQGRVALIVMEDIENRNMFTEELMSGLARAFGIVRQQEDTRAVVVSGYETVFSAGGTREELLEISAGRLAFTDISLYNLFLDCEVPVIAAMQGHALGGGLVLGSFADVIVLAEESIYSANFMNYGFTPGFGSTYILPRQFGTLLGNEMLYSGRNYFGREIRERGPGIKVAKRSDVLRAALDIAVDIADKPKLSLTLLKSHLTRQLRSELQSAIDNELSMHRLTFSQPEVSMRIHGGFQGGTPRITDDSKNQRR